MRFGQNKTFMVTLHTQKIKKKVNASAVATNSESCSGGKTSGSGTDIFLLGNAMLERNKCVYNVSENGQKEADASNYWRQIFRENVFVRRQISTVLHPSLK